jgi:cell wall assembly regulator SMI1
MQKFTRSLTREVEVGGERLALTFSAEGLSVRPVGSRRPPHEMSWDACVCACVNQGGNRPTPEEVGRALKALKTSADRPARDRSPAGEPGPGGETPGGGEETPAQPGRGAPSTNGGQTAAGPPAATGLASLSPEHPAPSGGAAPALAGLLGRLDRWLADHRARYHRGLLPGAAREELESLRSALGWPLPPDLETWLTWHNGQKAEVFGALEGDWHPMSAAEIAEAKQELDAGGHEGWQRNWIPFLDDDNGDYLCLDPGQPGTPVRECWRGRAEHDVVAPSLASWVERLLGGLEKGAYTEDPERGSMHRS